MWVVLAVIAFALGQVYLFRSLKKMDEILAKQEEPEEKEMLSLAFSDPSAAEQTARLLAEFSRENPEVEMVLHTDPEVPEAVREGRAAVGFLTETLPARHGLSSFVVKSINARVDIDFVLNCGDLPPQQIIWRTGTQSDCTNTFLQYLRQSGGNLR